MPTFYFGGMQFGGIEKRVREIAEVAAAENKVEFIQLEIAGSKRSPIFRVYIDKPDGVTVENCADVSRSMESVLDAGDVIPTKYVLEVSSPGLERQLYSVEDYRRFSGKLARIKAGTQNFVGRIVGVENSDIIFDDRSSGSVKIPFADIARANLKVDLDEEFRKRR